MIKSKKQSLIVIGAFILVLLLGTTTYAFFNYTRTGSSNTIKVGRISFVTRQLNTIYLTNVFPIDKNDIDTDTDNVDEVVIEIVGDTDYSEGIEYLVSSVDSNINVTHGNKMIDIPISLDVTVDDDLGEEDNNYFTSRDDTDESIYKVLVGDTLVGDQMLLVGYIVPNSTSGTIEGIDGTISIKAFFDKDKILISDTYDGTESDNMGTTNNDAEGKTVLTTSEWNTLQTNGVSFKVKVEANEGIWVNGSLEEIMRTRAVMDNISSTYVSASTGINFGAISSDTNGKGVYMRAGTENDAYPILYYRGAVEDNNVVFNNKCWKAVRTTDTGGVKLIYNGNITSSYESDINYSLEPIPINAYKIKSTTDLRWTFDSSDNTWNIEIDDNTNPSIEFFVPNGVDYTLILTGTSGSSCGGGYRFYKNGSSVSSLGNGGGASMDLTYDYGNLTNEDVIKMNYEGTSNSGCKITFKLKMIGHLKIINNTSCVNNAEFTEITTAAFNLTNNSSTSVGYMFGENYLISSSNWISGARFGSGFTWDGTSYTLVDDTPTTPNSTHHYSCNVATEGGTCTQLRYVYYVSGNTKYYITLTGGEGINEAFIKMQANTNDSNMKQIIDSWYRSNMTSVTNKLEDTIWCNDRSLGDNSANGWIANGGDLSKNSYYGAYERSDYSTNSNNKNKPSLICTNKNDSFSVRSGKGNGSLTYPVALLTSDELVLAGATSGGNNTSYYLFNSDYYWSMSPFDVSEMFATLYNIVSHNYYNIPAGVRPAISIKPDQLITKGIGTVVDPYVIE